MNRVFRLKINTEVDTPIYLRFYQQEQDKKGFKKYTM